MSDSKLKHGWEIKKLGEVCDFENGDRGTNYPSKAHRTQTGIPFINAGHLSNNGIDFKEMDYISTERYELLSAGKIRKNDILFCLRGSLGKFASVENLDIGAIASSLVILRPKESILHRYLLCYLESNICVEMINNYKGGAAQPNLSAGSLRNFKIPIPPLLEQEKIVSILDKVFSGIEHAKQNAEKNLKNAKEVFDSYLNSIFNNKGEDWEVKNLGDICENLDSKRVPITKSSRTAGSVPYYGASGIVDYVSNYIFDEDLLCVSEDGANLLARTYPIAFSISGKTWVNNHAHVLRFNNMVTQKFVELYLNSIKLDDYVSGMAQPKLNQTMLNKIPIPTPQLPEQEKLVIKLDDLSKELKQLESIYQQKLIELEDLKKSILQKAFNGELC